MKSDYSEPVLITWQWEISVCDNNKLHCCHTMVCDTNAP
jgi:hypothetical protein